MEAYRDLLSQIHTNCKNIPFHKKLSAYNIFDVLEIQSREVIMCRFLTNLLNPEGMHGCGIRFLKSFIRDVLKMDPVSDTLLLHTEVVKEYPIDKERRIDIFIRNAEYQIPIEVKHVDNGLTFEIGVTVFSGESYAKVRIVNYHTNIVLIEKNGEKLLEIKVEGENEEGLTDRSLLDMKSIWDFVNTVDIADIYDVLHRQIEYNTAISEEGLRGNYGANIGSVLLDMEGTNIRTRAKAKAAAGSDARMNGCELPVIINSGSGNQGMTCSLPVIEYAKELKVSEEKLYRALALSNLVAIHQKTGIGRLSAYCGAVCAGAAAGTGIAYLCGGGYAEVTHTVVNALAITSGIVCDGAKASCAAKIAAAVDAGILGYNMYIRGQQFRAGDGIVTNGADETIRNVGRLGKDGMKETNDEIISIMVHDRC